MKKFIMSLFLIPVISGLAFASNGGFQDTNNKISVSDALKMPDNSYVTVQGNITKRLTDDEYLFKDTTGNITVEIDNNKWMGVVVNPSDKVELSGEIEKKFNSVKIDVDSVKKLN